jgi:Protein of unknown function (DUF3168)
MPSGGRKMPDYAYLLNRALIARLSAVVAVTALVDQRIYDEPPQGVGYPYVGIGGIEPRPLRSDGGTAATVTFSIEVHSRPGSGRTEATRIAHAVRTALDGHELAVAGLTAVTMQWRGQTVSRAEDGRSYIAIVAFTTILDT